jgi:hypothetical protein
VLAAAARPAPSTRWGASSLGSPQGQIACSGGPAARGSATADRARHWVRAMIEARLWGRDMPACESLIYIYIYTYTELYIRVRTVMISQRSMLYLTIFESLINDPCYNSLHFMLSQFQCKHVAPGTHCSNTWIKEL